MKRTAVQLSSDVRGPIDGDACVTRNEGHGATLGRQKSYFLVSSADPSIVLLQHDIL